MIVLVVFAAVLGLAVGSFLNVVIYRVPAGISVVSPRSACPDCGSAIRAYDNVPVISWLVLRGRCRDCGSRISGRYPAVELVTGLVFAAIAFRFAGPVILASSVGDAVSAGSVLVAFLYLGAISIALAMIDVDTHRLPNPIVLPSYLVASTLLMTAAIASGDGVALIRAAAGAGILGLAYFIMAFAYPGGMGLGDVKLAVLLGFYLGWLGWAPLIVGGFAAFLLGGVYAAGLLIVRRASRKSGIPFGPWMLLGAAIGAFFGDAIAAGYLSLVGLD